MTIGEKNTELLTWTNKNVPYLGIYVGNDNPELETFGEILPIDQ